MPVVAVLDHHLGRAKQLMVKRGVTVHTQSLSARPVNEIYVVIAPFTGDRAAARFVRGPIAAGGAR